MVASQEGYKKVCRVLIKNGADIDATKVIDDGVVSNATLIAAANDNGIAELLLRRSKKCASCGATAQDKGKKSLDKCSGCGVVFYCHRQCQVKHWKGCHKGECKKLKNGNGTCSTCTQ